MITFQQESSGPPSFQMPWSVQVDDDGSIIHGRPDADYLVGFAKKGSYNIEVSRPEAIAVPAQAIGFCPVYQFRGEMFIVDLPVATCEKYEASPEGLERLRQGEAEMRAASARVNGVATDEQHAATERMLTAINDRSPLTVELSLEISEHVFAVVNREFGMQSDPLLYVPVDGFKDGYTDVIAINEDERVLKITVSPDGTVEDYWLN